MAVRLALMADHYRADRQWTDDCSRPASSGWPAGARPRRAPAGPSGDGLLAAVRERLADDLDTPGALAVVDAWADAALAGAGDDTEAPALMASTVDALLGVRL